MATGCNDAQYVLEQMEVCTLSRAYELGCGAQRVTVLSQQYRAFNLVWAMFSEGRLKAGDQVGVVGGGIGGLTVAAAALLMGCRVIIVEHRSTLMHLQRLNRTRLLHPNIYEWPDLIADQKATALPSMNWSADMAGQVVDVLDKEWAQLNSKYNPIVRTETEVTNLEAKGADGKLAMMSSTWESELCDAVILAVGFGVETPIKGLSHDTYWDNDKLEQPVRGPQQIRRYFVSGLGDGGCIDVLRLSYENFNHVEFASRFIRIEGLQSLRTELLGIDSRMPATERSRYLKEEYRKLNFPTDLARLLGTPRKDTYVELNGTEPFPYSSKSCILHRVAICGLEMAGRFKYCPGSLDTKRIETRSSSNGIKYMVPDPGGGGSSSFDAVIVRHGPNFCSGLSTKIRESAVGIPEDPIRDRTRRQLYPDDFYPPRKTLQVERSDIVSEAVLETRSDWRGLDDAVSPPIVVETRIQAIANPVRFSATGYASVISARIEFLVLKLKEETQAQNFPAAKDAAESLDSLLQKLEAPLLPSLWQEAHSALFDFEMLTRARAEAGGESLDLTRLRELTWRVEHGNR